MEVTNVQSLNSRSDTVLHLTILAETESLKNAKNAILINLNASIVDAKILGVRIPPAAFSVGTGRLLQEESAAIQQMTLYAPAIVKDVKMGTNPSMVNVLHVAMELFSEMKERHVNSFKTLLVLILANA